MSLESSDKHESDCSYLYFVHFKEMYFGKYSGLTTGVSAQAMMLNNKQYSVVCLLSLRSSC